MPFLQERDRLTKIPPPAWSADVRPRLIPSVELNPVELRGAPMVVLRDSRTRVYFQAPRAVADLVRLMDGERTVGDIARDASRLLQDDVTVEDVGNLLNQMWEYGFVEGSDPVRVDPVRWRRVLALPLLSFEGGDRFERFARLFRPLFSTRLGPVYVIAFVGLLAFFLYRVVELWGDIMMTMMRHVTDWRLFLLFFVFMLPITAIHEIAHGIAYVNFGGRRPRFGMILLLFVFLAFFTDVADTYRMKNKWQRVIVSLSGPLATLAMVVPLTFLWENASGLWKEAAFLLMVVNFVSVVSTVYPGFRSDIYFVLVDVLETPNLHEKSLKYIGSLIARPFRRVAGSVRADGPRQAVTFTVYGTVSTIAIGLMYYGIVVQAVVMTPLVYQAEGTFVEDLPWMNMHMSMRHMVDEERAAMGDDVSLLAWALGAGSMSDMGSSDTTMPPMAAATMPTGSPSACAPMAPSGATTNDTTSTNESLNRSSATSMNDQKAGNDTAQPASAMDHGAMEMTETRSNATVKASC